MMTMRTRLYGVIALLLALTLAYPLAAATTATPVLPQAPRLFSAVIQNSSGTNSVTLAACGTGAGAATKISSIFATNSDNVTYTMVILLNRASGNFILADVSVPANSGVSTSVVPVNILGPGATTIAGLPTDAFGQYLLCQVNDSIFVDVTTTVTAAKEINVIAQGADF